MKTTVKMMAAVLLWLMSVPVHGQTLSNFFQNNYYDFQTLDNFPKSSFFSSYSNQLGLTGDDAMVERECNENDDGRFDCRYDQYYKGYKVIGSSFMLHGQHGLVLSAGGNLVSTLNISVTSPISEATALANALDSIDAWEYEWEDSLAEGLHKDARDDNDATLYPVGELVIASIDTDDSTTSAENYRFVWKFGVGAKFIVGSDTPTTWYSVYVDAHTGDIVSLKDASQYNSFHTGNVLTYYDGWNTFRTWKCDICSDYRLRADRGLGIWTSWNRQCPSGCFGPYTQGPRDDDNNWSASNERSTVSAHWAIKVAWEYFEQEFGRAGSDGQGKQVNIYTDRTRQSVHDYAAYNDLITEVDRINVAETTDGYSPASLDVMGHEYTHAFITRSSGLNQEVGNRDALALNEGYADIFGHMIERSIRHTEDWNVGGDVLYTSIPRAYRLLNSPSSSNSPQPSGYGDFYWDVNKDAHKNSGVLLQWFYWFANGNGTLLPSIQGVGIEKAARIAYATMTWYLWPGVHYHDCRNQTLAAVADAYGKCSFEYVQAYKAWQAVNIDGPVGCKWWQIHGEAVVVQEQMGEPLDGSIGLRIFQSGEKEITEYPEAVVWVVPENWDYEISEDELSLTITNFGDAESQMVTAYVTYSVGGNDYTDTLTHIVHFVCEACDNNNRNGSQNNETDAASQKVHQKKIARTERTLEDIRIYPNPAADKKVNVYLPPTISGEVVLNISSVTGVKYKSLPLKDGKNTIALDELAAGMYFFEVCNGKDRNIERVFIQ